eukprot:CAMPEP_0170625812 /NCGR_PEP_ID=MMETSP0224-20130122/30979_1 /TAXON_ID=285029 /ORGANISM="Togula jolla, Strain CCCM 725" /LENGTH=412 /DNA_ID=CAMNT_0010952453 /DNA_START=15 /DNA_END=1253 /DNA_ORIENTATION=-
MAASIFEGAQEPPGKSFSGWSMRCVASEPAPSTANSAGAGSHRCSFSFDGMEWTEAVEPLKADREPGWDIYSIPTPPLKGCVGLLHVKRAVPLCSVRVHGDWPWTASPPLAAAWRPGGVRVATLVLPPAVSSLQQLLIAVRPVSATRSLRAESESPQDAGAALQASVAPGLLAAAEAAAAEAVAEEVAAEGPAEDERLRDPRGDSMVASGSELTPFRQNGLCGSFCSVPSAGLARWRQNPARWAACSVPSAALANLRLQVRELSSELEKDRSAREHAEAEALRATQEAAELREECDDLRRRLRGAERATMASDMQVRALTSEIAEVRRELQYKVPTHCSSIEEVVADLVTLELRALAPCSEQERRSAKRQLLLRWHPDKTCVASGGSGSGGGCRELATRVVQEMQCRPEWAS